MRKLHQELLPPSVPALSRCENTQGCVSANAKLVADVGKLGEERGLTAAQLSLAWVASQGDDVVPIPGTTKVANLMSNVAAEPVALSEEECALVAAAVPHDQVVGERYSGGDSSIWKGNL